MGAFDKLRLKFFSQDAVRISHLRWVVLLCSLSMYALSWRLWMYQAAYPSVPFFSFIPYAGPVLSKLLFFLMLASLVLCLTVPSRRVFGVMYLGLSVLLILQDQNRFQPWAYQFMLFILALDFMPAEESIAWLRWLTAGIYLYSGAQKINHSFIHGEAVYILDPFLRPWNLRPQYLPGNMLVVLALGIAFWETALAPGLLIKKTRPYALSMAIIMHLMILFSLGPWGHDWNQVVWPWNLFMIASDFLLFASASQEFARGVSLRATVSTGVPALLCRSVLIATLVLPVLKFVDAFDSYPAFTLYSSFREDSAVFIRWEDGLELPQDIQKHLKPPFADDAGNFWAKLDLIGWSVGELNVPPYPQNRAYEGAALALCERFNLGDAVVLVRHLLPDLMTGKTLNKTLSGCEAIRIGAQGYRLNAWPVANLENPLRPISAAALKAMRGGYPSDADIEAGLDSFAQRDYAAAEKDFLAALKTEEDAPQPDDTQIAACLQYLAVFYSALDEFASAELTDQTLLEVAKRIPNGSFLTASALKRLTLDDYLEGNYAQAAKDALNLADFARSKFGPNQPDVATALSDVAAALKRQGRYAEAKRFYVWAISIYPKTLGRQPGAAQDLDGLADIAEHQNQNVQAEALYKKALLIQEKTLGSMSLQVAGTLENYASLLAQTGRGRESSRFKAWAEKIYELKRKTPQGL